MLSMVPIGPIRSLVLAPRFPRDAARDSQELCCTLERKNSASWNLILAFLWLSFRSWLASRGTRFNWSQDNYDSIRRSLPSPRGFTRPCSAIG